MSKTSFNDLLPIVQNISNNTVPVNIWDIPYTIKQLSYLTHDHYRYYGKFPSSVAAKILDQYPPKNVNSYVLDNFCGSGTTLVEAKIRGIKSIGIDISWISALASNIKSKFLVLPKIKEELNYVINKFNEEKYHHEDIDYKFVSKWFSEKSYNDLYLLRRIIYDLEKTDARDFLLLAFLGIIRRVSKAHDAEVRPHVNKLKKERDVISAFSKKVNDMCVSHQNLMEFTKEDVYAECYLCNNLDIGDAVKDKDIYLVISHPPYLNSFNYSSVFNLEFFWGSIFEDEYNNKYKNFHKNEMKAHPANEKITNDYFAHLKYCYEETYKIQKDDSYLAIVIGDCTRKGELVPVIDKTIDIVTSIGYSLQEINYRTTHYGLGKYAYRHRADYHGDDKQKKDAIIIFKK